jgi:broad specificity phosphatase PhoE
VSGHSPVIVTLVRHGAVDGPPNVFRGRADAPLHADGWRQLAQREPALTDPPPGHVLTSPRSRCRAWAQALAGRLGVACEVDDALAEADFGDWDDLPYDTVAARDPQRLAAVDADPWQHAAPGGETLTQVADRADAALRARLDRGLDGALLVVTHAGVMRAVAGRWLGLEGRPVRLAMAPAAWMRWSWLHGHAPWLVHHDAGMAVPPDA